MHEILTGWDIYVSKFMCVLLLHEKALDIEFVITLILISTFILKSIER